MDKIQMAKCGRERDFVQMEGTGRIINIKDIDNVILRIKEELNSSWRFVQFYKNSGMEKEYAEAYDRHEKLREDLYSLKEAV